MAFLFPRLAATAMSEFALRNPVQAAVYTGMARYGICDTLVQAGEQGVFTAPPRSASSSSASSSSFLDRVAAFRPDLHRMGSFMAFVAFYSAGPGYLAYNVLYPRFLPGRPLVTAVLDAIVTCTVLYYPPFYVVSEGIQNGWTTRPASELVSTALGRWQTNMGEDVAAMAAFWIPANYMNFRFVPLHLRMPVMSLVGAGWAAILSGLRGAEATSSSSSSACAVDVGEIRYAAGAVVVEGEKTHRVMAKVEKVEKGEKAEKGEMTAKAAEGSGSWR